MAVFAPYLDPFSGIDRLASLIGSWLVSAFGSMLGAAVFLLTALSVMRMGRTLGMRQTWLSWIPGAQEYYLGRLADECTVRRNGGSTRYRILLPVMLGLRLLLVTVLAICALLLLAVVLGLLMDVAAAMVGKSAGAAERMVSVSIVGLIAGTVTLLLTLLTMIPRWMALNRIYLVFIPARSGVLTLLNVLVPVSIPITLLAVSRHTPAEPQTNFTEYI